MAGSHAIDFKNLTSIGFSVLSFIFAGCAVFKLIKTIMWAVYKKAVQIAVTIFPHSCIFFCKLALATFTVTHKVSLLHTATC